MTASDSTTPKCPPAKTKKPKTKKSAAAARPVAPILPAVDADSVVAESTVTTTDVESTASTKVEPAVAPDVQVAVDAEPSEATSRPAKKKKAKAKAAPKKPSTRTPSNYMLFAHEHRKQVISANPTMKMGEISKCCGKAWKELTEADRQPWNEKAADLKRKRLEEVALLSADQPPAKKKTPSSFLLFSIEEGKAIKAATPTLRVGEISKLCGAKWRALSEDEKDIWKAKAREVKAAHSS